MSELTIELVGRAEFTPGQFRPGEQIRCVAGWQLDEPAEALEARLFWYTAGKGDQDVGVVETERIEAPSLEGSREFSFKAPRSPYSFSGTLITLTWALELVALPREEMARQELVISPSGREIRLGPDVVDGAASPEPW